ncbi:hypothetical protein LguiA_031374 [Lonicera macranthoides]
MVPLCYRLSTSLLRQDLMVELGFTIGSSFKFVAKMENHSSTVMAAMNPIDISSSDSDFDVWDIDDDIEPDASTARESATLTKPRNLPSWVAATHGPWLMGQGGPAQSVPSNGNSSSFNHHTLAKIQMQPSSSSDLRISNTHIAHEDNSNYYTGNGYGKHSFQLPLKRNLPTHLQPSVLSARSSNPLENAGSSEMHETHADTFYPRWSKLNSGADYNKDHFGGDSDDEVIMYEKVGSGILPPSSMHARPVSTAQYVNSSDHVYRSGVAEERASEHDERLVYQAALQDLNQPKVEASLPDGLLSVSLLRHQKIALAWLLQKETVSLHCLGGILADDQGLGKTISMIALIQMQRYLQSKSKLEDQCNETTEALNLEDDDDKVTSSVDKRKPSGSFCTPRPAAGTLVVCPASVLRQWARELKEKVAKEAKLSVLIYHGSNRTKDPIELASYDVVLTTYAIVTNEVPKQPLADNNDDDDRKNGERYGLTSAFSKKQKKASNVSKKRKKGRNGIDNFAMDCASGTLAKVGWHRVILDEAQTIKNHRTQVARACCGLRAKRRWCLSGTPIQNAIEELFSYFRFLRYDPYASYKSFCNAIKHPISRDSSQGYKKLQAVLRAIMLRRTKGTLIDGEPIINLPPKTIHLDKVDFSAKERAFYSKLETDSRTQFKAYAAAGTVNQNYANILLMLLRLRQACDHPLLVKGFNSDTAGRASMQTAKRLPRDMLLNLLNLLETSLPICRVCGDPPEDAVISSMCGHIFCYQCASEYLTGDDNMCPTSKCKEQLAADFLFSKATLRSCISDEDLDDNPSSSSDNENYLVLQNDYNSSKIKIALEILQSHCKSVSPIQELHNLEGPIKAIVFSQWTRMLDLVEVSLKKTCLKYRRLDGTMNLGARDMAVGEFNTDPEVTVMLMSLKAGNLGLNMVAASHVILLDLWWNPTTEDQAVDRAHRIGQTRPVTVSRITIKDTVEERILNLQEEKRKMVASAFGEDYTGGSATRLTVEDLKYLFML